MKTGKSNSFMKMGLYMLAGAVLGGLFGIIMYKLLDSYGNGIEGAAALAFGGLQAMILPILVVLLTLSLLAGEFTLRKLKCVEERLPESEDEEYDRLDYEEEKWGALSMNLNTASQVLCILVLSAGYSGSYLANSDAARDGFLYACLVFLLCIVYNGIWQIRLVKLVQLGHPGRDADPSSLNFQKKWLESCDEAEREVIYRSSYKAYMTFSRFIPALLILTMLGNLFFDTGMLAVIVVGVIWLAVTVTYTRSCVTLKGEKALMK